MLKKALKAVNYAAKIILSILLWTYKACVKFWHMPRPESASEMLARWEKEAKEAEEVFDKELNQKIQSFLREALDKTTEEISQLRKELDEIKQTMRL